MSVLLASVLAASAPAPESDLRCMAAYLFIVGQMTDDTAAGEERAGATAMVMYFFGKVRAASPNLDVKSAIRRLVEAPRYLDRDLKTDIDRCGAEYTARGEELRAFGDD